MDKDNITVFEAFILGAVQGLTEFLPVSSSGHLAFLKSVMGIGIENPLTFDVILHIGTTLAVVLFVFDELLSKLKSKSEIIKVGVAFVSTVPIALVLENLAEKAEENLAILSFSYFIGSIIIFLSIISFKIKERKLLHFILIGIAQGISAMPGISRSGSTISTAMILGLTPPEAFNFSFILSIPTIISAIGYKILKSLLTGSQILGEIGIVSASAGILSAFVSGLAALFVLRRIVITKKFWAFGFYKLLMSLLALAFYLTKQM